MSSLSNKGEEKMIEFEIDVELFSNIMAAVSTIRKEPTMIFDTAGVAIVTMNEVKTLQLQCVLKKSNFVTYDVDQRYKVSFDISTLSSLFRAAQGVLMVTIKGNLCSFMLPSKYGFKSFEVPLLGEFEPTLSPKLSYESECKIDLGSLEEIVSDARKVDSEFIRCSVSGNDIEIRLKGTKGDTRTMIERGKGLIYSKFEENSKCVFGRDILEDLLKVPSYFTSITNMEFAKRLLPIRFTHQVPFDGKLIQYIAPIDDKEVYKE